MAEKLNTAMRNRLADSLGDDFNSGKLRLYTGAQPASGDDAASGTLLVEITLPPDAFAAAASGAAAKSGTWSGTASNTGTAGWFRMLNNAGTRSIDGAVTATGGGGEIELVSTSITSGQPVEINSFTLNQPGA
jgi:hypothetical protein